MPDSMRKDVGKVLESIPATRKRPERFTRKEQAKQAVSGIPEGPAAVAAGPASTAAAPQDDQVQGMQQASVHSCLSALVMLLLLTYPERHRSGLNTPTLHAQSAWMYQ